MKRCLLLYALSICTCSLWAQKPHLNNHLVETSPDSLLERKNTVVLETPDGIVLRGELRSIDSESRSVILGSSSDSTSVDFKNIYKVYDGDFDGATGYYYRLDAPERFFFTPMGQTMRAGMVSLDNFFFLNNQIKVGILDNLEAGLGITLYPVQDNEDTSVAILPMASLKYKFMDRRHLKASVGFTSLQLPQAFAIQNVQFGRRAWFHVLYAAADWQYKFGTFSFAAAQPYLNLYPLKNGPSTPVSDEGLDYMFSASFSVKVFPFAHLISENVFFSGAWNVPGRPNTVARSTYLMPLLGGRYYGDYYSFAGGFSNILIPNAVVFFYLGGSYFFE